MDEGEASSQQQACSSLFIYFLKIYFGVLFFFVFFLNGRALTTCMHTHTQARVVGVFTHKWSDSSRAGSRCAVCRRPACPHFEKKFLRLPRPRLHFLPRLQQQRQRQRHLNSASHFSQNEGYVSQTGSNWPLPWFPHWKEQLEEGGAGGCVT